MYLYLILYMFLFFCGYLKFKLVVIVIPLFKPEGRDLSLCRQSNLYSREKDKYKIIIMVNLIRVPIFVLIYVSINVTILRANLYA